MAVVKITDIKPTKAGRYSIFTDGEYALSVDEVTLVTNKLAVGLTLDVSELMDINVQSEFEKAKVKAYDILSRRDHSEKELFDKLNKKFADEICSLTVDYLREIGYCNDERFAKMYLQYLINKDKYSIRALKQEMKKKGLDEFLIEETMERVAVEDSETVKNFVVRKYKTKLNTFEEIQKAKQAILRRGFSYDSVNTGMKQALDELGLEEKSHKQETYNNSSDNEEEQENKIAEIKALVMKKYKAKLTDRESVMKVKQALMRRGYSYGLINDTMKELLEELELEI